MNADNPSQTWVFGPGQIDEGVQLLQSARRTDIPQRDIVRHPAIQKLYPEFSVDNLTVTDTLVLSRLIRADLKEQDYRKTGPTTTSPGA